MVSAGSAGISLLYHESQGFVANDGILHDISGMSNLPWAEQKSVMCNDNRARHTERWNVYKTIGKFTGGLRAVNMIGT